jgi:hypothetical protein
MTVLLAALAQHLTSITGQRDLSIVSHLLLRHLPGFERVVGQFGAPLVMRISTDDAPSFETLIARAHEAVTGAFDHSAADVLAIAPKLFRLFFNYLYTAESHGAPEPPPPGVTCEEVPLPGKYESRIGYDLILYLAHRKDRISLEMMFSRELFRQEGATRLLQGYIETVERLCVKS